MAAVATYNHSLSAPRPEQQKATVRSQPSPDASTHPSSNNLFVQVKAPCCIMVELHPQSHPPAIQAHANHPLILHLLHVGEVPNQ
eukprot:1159351-Pelagomonas_calceolata.AAC.2